MRRPLAELTRMSRFALVSVSGTLVHYAVLVALVETDTLGPLPSSALGFLAGAVTNYLGSRRWVFASDARHVVALPKFLAVAATGFAGNVAGMALALDWLELPYLLAQILVTGILFFWHYGANRLWTFARRG